MGTSQDTVFPIAAVDPAPWHSGADPAPSSWWREYLLPPVTRTLSGESSSGPGPLCLDSVLCSLCVQVGASRPAGSPRKRPRSSDQACSPGSPPRSPICCFLNLVEETTHTLRPRTSFPHIFFLNSPENGFCVSLPLALKSTEAVSTCRGDSCEPFKTAHSLPKGRTSLGRTRAQATPTEGGQGESPVSLEEAGSGHWGSLGRLCLRVPVTLSPSVHPAQHPAPGPAGCMRRGLSPQAAQSRGASRWKGGCPSSACRAGGSLLPACPFPAVLLSCGSLQRQRGHMLGHSSSSWPPWGRGQRQRPRKHR